MRRFVVLVIDLVLITAATVAAVFLREDLEYSFSTLIGIIPHICFTLAIATAIIPALGLSTSVWRYSTLGDYLRVVAAAIIIVAGASGASFIFNRLDGVSRSLPVLQAMLIVFAMVGVRVLSRVRYSGVLRMQSSAPARPQVSRQESVLIVGVTTLSELYLRSISQFAPGRIRVEGLLGSTDQFVGSSIQRLPILGTPEEIAAVLRKLEIHGVAVDRIVVANPFEQLSPKAQQALLQVEASTTIRMEFLAEQLGFDERAALDGIESDDTGMPKTMFKLSERDILRLNTGSYWRIKRYIDIAVAAAMLAVALPLMLVVGVLVAVDVGFPVMFWQQRPGRGGVPIRLYKFRTMASAHDSHGRRICDTRRMSAIGRFLRRTRLDELPQLFSILSGEMSFVGPRPLLPIDQAPEFAARLLVRPGLTGWAQVNGGREVSATDKAAMDIWYVCNASFVLDLKILLRTLPMVLFGDKTRDHDIQIAWRDLCASGICRFPSGDLARQAA
ncbi:MAG TPA: sugar transferase [Hyphomicrobium sp.]|nr:sugar transferase [Hyphomicrobium sp.]